MKRPPFRTASAVLLVSASALTGCATTSARSPVIAYDDPLPAIVATPAAEPPRAVEIVTISEPLPLPGQLKPVTESARQSEPADPRRRVGDANAAARIQPVRDGFLNAIQQYPWTDGALYQVYTAPGQVTDIALQEGVPAALSLGGRHRCQGLRRAARPDGEVVLEQLNVAGAMDL